jgi:hypothetical protein
MVLISPMRRDRRAATGSLLSASFSGLPLVLCGTLKIVYDLALLYSFRHLKAPEESGPL